MLTLASSLLLVAALEKPAAGEVKLPLRDYLALVERVEALETARAKARSQAEKPVAELVSQRLSLTLRDSEADFAATFEVEVRGQVTAPVPLPLAGVAQRITVEPPGPAAVQHLAGGLALVAPDPGHYRVQVAGKVAIARQGGSERLALPPMTAPVAEIEVSLPSDRAWKCAGAVVAEDVLLEGRRRLRLAVPRGETGAFETRRDVKPAELPKALASAVVVTIVSLGRDAVTRHDVVLYEVQRGEIGVMAVTLPPGLEPEGVATDEGEATPWLEGRALRVERQKKLTATGYLAVTSQPAAGESIPLASVQPEAAVRARYVAYASEVAGSVAPDGNSWLRADLGDLPAPVREAASALGLVAAWRLRQEPVGTLRTTVLPPPPMLDAFVKERSTTTLLTVEGTLVHRDRFLVEAEGPAFELALPAGATIWSALVNDVPVRPLERAGRIVVPLGLATSSTRSVELVVVQERSVPPGRSTLRLAAPEVTVPVLTHKWSVLLPARNRYRFLSGDVGPTPRVSEEPRRLEAGAGGKAIRLGLGGSGGIRGRVVDASGAVIPGAAVVLTGHDTARALSLKTDTEGEFYFGSLPAGAYSLRVDMPGFRSASYDRVRVQSGDTRAYVIKLEVGTITESVQVASPAPLATLPAIGIARNQLDMEEQAQAFRIEAGQLKQGLVGGVKPVQVSIPETGKILSLAGALPPSRVSVEIEVKAPKD